MTEPTAVEILAKIEKRITPDDSSDSCLLINIGSLRALIASRGVLREATTIINWVRISTHGYPEHRRRLLILTDDKKEDAALGWFQGFYRDQPEWQIKPVSWLPFKPAYWAYLEFPK